MRWVLREAQRIESAIVAVGSAIVAVGSAIVAADTFQCALKWHNSRRLEPFPGSGNSTSRSEMGRVACTEAQACDCCCR